MPFWIAFLASALAAYPIYKILLALKSRQTVSEFAPEGHQKKQGTPTMGGLIIVFGVFAWWFLTLSGSDGGHRDAQLWKWLWSCFVLLIGFAGIGFVDDFVVPRLIAGKRGLGWKQKILMQVVLAVLATGLLLGWNVDIRSALYVFLILFCANAYNFLDGLDALAGSVLIALCGGLMVLSSSAPMGAGVGSLLIVLIGATIPFLYLNAPPAKIFMGDVGSLPIGALLGLVFSTLMWPSVAGWTFYTPYSTMSEMTSGGGFNSLMILPLLVVGFVLVAELIPVPLQIFWVKVFKRKLFIYTPIHHAFEKKGWAESRVVWTFLLSQILLGALAFSLLAATSNVPDARTRYYDAAPGAQR